MPDRKTSPQRDGCCEHSSTPLSPPRRREPITAGSFVSAITRPQAASSALSNHPHDEDQDDRPDEACDQIADPTGTEPEPHEAEKPTSNSGPDDPEDDVHQKSHVALHELLGKPAGNSTDNDGGDPTDFHRVTSQQCSQCQQRTLRCDGKKGPSVKNQEPRTIMETIQAAHVTL